MFVTINEKFLKPTPKVILFLSFGLFCFLPTIVLYIIYQPGYALEPGAAPYTFPLASYLIGLTFYVSKFPERCSKSGKFDYLLSSHQIHHVFVVIGILFSFAECFDVYRTRLAFVCPDELPATV